MPRRARLRANGAKRTGGGLRTSLGDDAPWLAVLAAATTIEFLWWLACWAAKVAPAPFVLSYVVLAFAGLAAAAAARALLVGPGGLNWCTLAVATVLVGVGASLFLPIKYAIPTLVPFWLDGPLAIAERAVFTTDPWRLLDQSLGWATVPVDRLYGLWLPTQALALFAVMTAPASRAKAQVLIAYVLTWFLLGVVAATILSSAGPIFYDRLFGGIAFAPLRASLEHRGAWVALGESDRMWQSLASGRPGFVAGISAAPSIHVAISVWMILAARALAPRAMPVAAAYALLIWIASVQLGWHYVSDGLAGAIGVLAIWRFSRWIEAKLSSSPRLGGGDQAGTP